MLTRNDILNECVKRCLIEMYKYAQPSLDFSNILEKIKTGEFKDDEAHPLYEQHYLSYKNYKFILKHYLHCYGLFDFWKDSVDLITTNLEKGGIKNKYVPAEKNKPGYKSYEEILPLKDIIGEDSANRVISIIKDYGNFYKHGSSELDRVTFTISLGCSPVSNKQTVIDYWKSKGKDINIKDIDVESIYYGDDDVEDEIKE